jgi:hypothetical protein
MNSIVFTMCGVWFWLTRRRRIRDYSSAAYSLTLAHAHLLNDFRTRASIREHGNLLPDQLEALNILEAHAASTYLWATRFDSLRQCCRYIAEELTPAIVAPAPARRPRLVLAPSRSAAIRVRFRLPRPNRLPELARFLNAEDSGALWNRALSMWPIRRSHPALAAVQAKQQQLPLKAA